MSQKLRDQEEKTKAESLERQKKEEEVKKV
jgi:hypothetical protein